MPKNPCTLPGYMNGNKQKVVAATVAPSATFRGQKIYRLKCAHCRSEYGANGCDIHERRCPNCQSGAKGEVLRDAAPKLFE